MIAVDTSVIVPALLTWHEFHERAIAALQNRKGLILPFPVLCESYSVLTRLPSPYRLSPNVAYRLLHESFGKIPIATLPADRAWPFFGHCEASGIAGGRVYDAVIATIAIHAGATELLTLNPRDFEPFADRLSLILP